MFYFRRKSPIFPQMCFFLMKCWICWICWKVVFEKCASFCGNVEHVEYVESSSALLATGTDSKGVVPKMIQHIQHVQHFSRKKHIFWRAVINIFNIFNISAERSIFCSKSGSFCRKNWTWKNGSFSRNIQHRQKRSFCRNNPTYPQKRGPPGKCWIVGFLLDWGKETG